MKIPIPDDWDGESWECYQIQWPKSDKWLGQLLGALSLYSRGRYWDEATGSILDVQAVGRAIFDRNYPLSKCDGSPEVPGEETTDTERAVRVALGYWELECDDMACIDISDLLKIEGGVLYALDNCCNWVAIGSISGADSVPVPPTNPLEDPESDPPQTWYACGKATSLVDTLVAILTDAIAYYSSDPWEFRAQMATNWSHLGQDLIALTNLWGYLQIFLSVLDGGYIKGDPIPDLIKCKLVVHLENTSTVSDDEYDHVRSSIRSALYDYYGSLPILGSLGAEAVYQIWDAACDMIGRSDIKNTMLLGAGTEGDCDCPDLPAEVPSDLDWFHEYDFTTAALFSDPGDTADYLAGQGWESNEFGGYDINLVCPGAHKTNTTGSTQTTYLTWARITLTACDPWVSGAKETKIRLHLGAGDLDASFQPLDGAQVQLWQGYLTTVTANGATSSVEFRVIRDECGTGSYHAIVSKIEIGGYGYDPLVDLP